MVEVVQCGYHVCVAKQVADSFDMPLFNGIVHLHEAIVAWQLFIQLQPAAPACCLVECQLLVGILQRGMPGANLWLCYTSLVFLQFAIGIVDIVTMKYLGVITVIVVIIIVALYGFRPDL